MENISKDKFEFIDNKLNSEQLARPRINYWQDVWRRLSANKVAVVSLVVLVIIVLLTIFGPILSPYGFEEMDVMNQNKPPSEDHWFGTDNLGRDVFVRVWQGGRISMIIGLLGALISCVVGCIYGGISAYAGGVTDDIMMRIVEVLLSVPYLIVVILISVISGSSNITSLIVAMTLTGWCGTARLVRGQILQLKQQEFVMAAEALGVSPMTIIMKHLIPNTLGIIIVSITFDIPGYIFSESFLSYIGLGVQPPDTSWGSLAAAAQQQFMFYPTQLLFPSLMIALTMLSFTLMGDGLRDALDPKLRK